MHFFSMISMLVDMNSDCKSMFCVMCFCSPPDPHQDACSWILSEDSWRNFALISALPSSGIRQIRIHWLLNTVTVLSRSVLKNCYSVEHALNLLLQFMTMLYFNIQLVLLLQ